MLARRLHGPLLAVGILLDQQQLKVQTHILRMRLLNGFDGRGGSGKQVRPAHEKHQARIREAMRRRGSSGFRAANRSGDSPGATTAAFHAIRWSVISKRLRDDLAASSTWRKFSHIVDSPGGSSTSLESRASQAVIRLLGGPRGTVAAQSGIKPVLAARAWAVEATAFRHESPVFSVGWRMQAKMRPSCAQWPCYSGNTPRESSV